MKKPLSMWLLYALCFGVCLYVAIYLWSGHDEAFKFIEQTIESSHEIELRVGHVVHVSPDFSGEYSEKFVDSNKTVHIVVDVTGTKGNLKVNVFATKINGIWAIKDAKINGQPIELTN